MDDGVLPLEPEDPALVGGYRLRGRLGEGGMGVVYLAGAPGSYVAIKTMRAADLQDPEARARFGAEAACAGNVDGGYTPKVIGDGGDEDFPYLVTEYIAGRSLEQVVEADGPLSALRTLAVALSVADALAHIHEAGIVHRDINPGNILLGESGPRIIDLMGSPGWVAPERLTGGRATPAADVFGWGLLVAYAATGRHPFGPGDGTRLTERILNLAPDLHELEAPLHDLVAAALSKDPSARPQADALRRDLLAPGREGTAPYAIAELWTPPDHPYRPHPPIRIGIPAAVSLAAAIIAVLTLGRVFQPPAEAPPRPEARVVISTTPGPVVTVTTPGPVVTVTPPRAASPKPVVRKEPSAAQPPSEVAPVTKAGKPGQRKANGKAKVKNKSRSKG